MFRIQRRITIIIPVNEYLPLFLQSRVSFGIFSRSFFQIPPRISLWYFPWNSSTVLLKLHHSDSKKIYQNSCKGIVCLVFQRFSRYLFRSCFRHFYRISSLHFIRSAAWYFPMFLDFFPSSLSRYCSKASLWNIS